MSKFDFNMMDSAGYGFYRVWVERAYLLKLATIPMLIKFACMITVMVLGLDDNILRQGLILFPGVLAEGWVLAQFLRTLLKGERWPTVLPADPAKIDDSIIDKLLLRARGIVAATLVYGLLSISFFMIRYLILGLVFGDFQATNEDISSMLNAAEADPDHKLNVSPLLFFPMLGLLGALFWAVRFVWLYIPFSVLMPVKEYMRSLGGIMASVKMTVLYFCTMTPIMFLTIMISRVVYSGIGDGDSNDAARFIMIFFAVIADTLIALVSTAAFAWAMKDFLPKNTDLLKDLPKLSGDK